MPISTLPSAPQRTDAPSTFVTKADTFLAALPTFVSEANTLAATMSSIAAGTAMSVPYAFSTSTLAGDPGTGKLGLNSTTQNAATALYVNTTSSSNQSVTSILDNIDASTSNVKGQLKLVKLSDPTKWILYSVTARASGTNYRTLTISAIASSASSPFANGDFLVMLFTRTGDVGPAGTINRRLQQFTTGSLFAIDINNYDMITVAALANGATLGAPTGTLTDGRSIMFRIKDNGTARALSYNAVFRPSTDLPLPTTTVPNKVLYMGFMYNSTDSKWDLISVLNNV